MFLRTRFKHTTALHKKHPALAACPPLCAKGFPDHPSVAPPTALPVGAHPANTQLPVLFHLDLVSPLTKKLQESGVLSSLFSAFPPLRKQWHRRGSGSGLLCGWMTDKGRKE